MSNSTEKASQKEYEIRPRDLFLLVTILLVAAVLWLGNFFFFGKSGNQLVITVDGATYMECPLWMNQEITLTEQGLNKIQISDGKVQMVEADCPDQYCVHHSAIQNTNETIVCLPHKVVLEIRKEDQAGKNPSGFGQEPEIDTISQ